MGGRTWTLVAAIAAAKAAKPSTSVAIQPKRDRWRGGGLCTIYLMLAAASTPEVARPISLTLAVSRTARERSARPPAESHAGRATSARERSVWSPRPSIPMTGTLAALLFISCEAHELRALAVLLDELVSRLHDQSLLMSCCGPAIVGCVGADRRMPHALTSTRSSEWGATWPGRTRPVS